VLNHPNAWFAHDAVFRFDLEPVLQRIRKPLMILTYPGQQLYRTALKVAAMHPEFTLKVLDWNGRVPSFEQPELWADSVAAFLTQRH